MKTRRVELFIFFVGLALAQGSENETVAGEELHIQREEVVAPKNCSATRIYFKGNATNDRKMRKAAEEPTDAVNRPTNLNETNKENYTDTECEVFQLDKHLNAIYTENDIRNASADEEEDNIQHVYSVKYKNIELGIKLQFPTSPDGEVVVVDSLQDGSMPFRIFSVLMGSLQPAGFPLGMLQDARERRVPFHILFLQIIKLEGLIILWAIIWIALALFIPCTTISNICCPPKTLHRLEDHSSASSLTSPGPCGKRLVGLSFYGLLILLLLNLILMLGSNEQLSRSLTEAPGRAETIVGDLQRFVRNTDMQISFVATTSVEFATRAIEEDLDDVEAVLGIPFQENLADAFGLKNIFHALKEIQYESNDISHRVKYIMQECSSARNAAAALQRKLDELVPTLENIHQLCSQRDRPLCSTLVAAGFDVSFNTEEVSSNAKLKYLMSVLGNGEFSSNLEAAENNFNEIPRKVALDTATRRNDIQKILHRHRMSIHKAVRMLEDVSRSAISGIKAGGRKLMPVLERVASGDLWRYLAVLGTCIVTFVVWLCLMCGSPCGSENPHKTIPCLVLGLTFASLISMILWMIGTAALLAGVHGENFVCRPLRDDPNYPMLAAMFDDGGTFYPRGGFFKAFLQINETLQTAEILRNIERNQPAYSTFKLHNKINLTQLTEHTNWNDLNTTLSIDTKTIRILTYSLETHLLDFISASKLNLTHYRNLNSRPVTSKDLEAFLDQARAVAKQIIDGRTANRIEKFIVRLRDIVNNEYKLLGQFKDNILYAVTALEVVLDPLRAKSVHVLEKLKKFQNTVQFEGRNIADKLILEHKRRIDNYLDQQWEHVNHQITQKLAKTKSLWKIYQSVRKSICSETVDAFNALSFSCYLSILIALCLVPIATSVIKRYKDNDDNLRASMLDRDSPENQENWTTPPMPRNFSETYPKFFQRSSIYQGTPESVAEETSWASIRPTVATIPTPPRPPPSDTNARRDPSPRPPLPTISRSRSPFSRYDSLKMIERSTTRKNQSSSQSTSRSWI